MIKLSNIVDALYDVDISNSCYFNKKTEEILWKFGYDSKMSTYTEEDEFNEDIINMFDFYTKNDYDIILDFIDTIKDENLKYKLYNATRGRGAFKRFRSIIDSNDITNDWYKFRDNEYKEIAKSWCLENDIKYEEDC